MHLMWMERDEGSGAKGEAEVDEIVFPEEAAFAQVRCALCACMQCTAFSALRRPAKTLAAPSAGICLYWRPHYWQRWLCGYSMPAVASLQRSCR